MDMRTGQMFDTYDEAVKAGVPESDIAEIVTGPDGKPRPRFRKRITFTKGSFKVVEPAAK